jgi:excisionase family DNA binding protein
METIEKLLTVEQVGELLQLEVSTVQRYLKDGKITGAKFGRLWRVRESDLESYVNAKFGGKKAARARG